ncbi:MAG: transposase family protein [Deltaproteobacteria bacterium]|nr:transposase family protein [Deltaproteobacteria bacterium]
MTIEYLIKRLFDVQGYYLKDLKIYNKKVIIILDRNHQPDEYDRYWRRIRDCNWGEKEVYIEFPKLRYRAPNGIVRFEQLSFVGAYGRLTRRFEYYLAVLAQMMTPYQVAKHFGLDKKTVYRI